jgi:hypothetical protein
MGETRGLFKIVEDANNLLSWLLNKLKNQKPSPPQNQKDEKRLEYPLPPEPPCS